MRSRFLRWRGLILLLRLTQYLKVAQLSYLSLPKTNISRITSLRLRILSRAKASKLLFKRQMSSQSICMQARFLCLSGMKVWTSSFVDYLLSLLFTLLIPGKNRGNIVSNCKRDDRRRVMPPVVSIFAGQWGFLDPIPEKLDIFHAVTSISVHALAGKRQDCYTSSVGGELASTDVVEPKIAGSGWSGPGKNQTKQQLPTHSWLGPSPNTR